MVGCGRSVSAGSLARCIRGICTASITHTAVTKACHQHRLAAVKAAGTHRAQQRCEAGCKGLRFRLMVLAWHPLGEFHSPPPAGVTQEFQRWAHARVASEQPKRFLLPLLSPTSPHAMVFHPTSMLPSLHEQHVASVHAQACVMLRKSAALYYTSSCGKRPSSFAVQRGGTHPATTAAQACL